MKKTFRLLVQGLACLTLLILLSASPAHAYIGPGAGFAFVSSFMILIITFFLAFVTLLTWPIRWIFRSLRGRKALARSRVKRVVIVGLDGQDPDLTEQFMKEGLLPNFSKLSEQGGFFRLQTTLLAESPVAWSGFQTGCNPGRHKIFDFLVPNRKSYLPELSSAQIRSSAKTISLGKYQIPIGKPSIQVGRKSQPFWKILGDHGVFSTIIRVPITFPPEKFKGVLLSAMCVPDLKGSQGTFFYYTSDRHEKKKLTSGIEIPVELSNGTARSYLSGPENTMIKGGGEVRVPFEVRLGKNGSDSVLILDKKSYPLPLRKLTPYIRVNFKLAPGVSAKGLVQFYLIETSPHFKLYMTPINIDPDKPALPISHPFTYAIYLAKTLGPYSTLGLAEDTSALNEWVVDEDVFLQQAYQIHEEREKMLFDALEKTRRGAVVCVFDITDRLQHMFFRCLDPKHPANRGREVQRYKNVIRDLYKNMDDLLGRVMEKMDKDTVLMVMSDHGFKSFKRGVNLNTWLMQNGFLHMKEDAPKDADYLQGVDWSRTKAYAVGFGGIYLNMAGREAQGIVQPGEDEQKVKQEITAKLKELFDERDQLKPVREVYDTRQVYKGPYVKEAPDLIAGFRVGYRASWSSVTGGFSEEVFEDNDRAWAGDHNFNPPEVPGMLFTSRKIENDNPSIMDLGPTVLDLFGVPVPAYCDGKSLMPAKKKESGGGS